LTHRLVPHQSHGIGWIGSGVPSFTDQYLFNGSGFYDAGSGKRYVYLDGSWVEEHTYIRPEVWDTTTLSWVAATQTTLTTGSLTVSSTTDLTKIGGVNVGVDNALAVKPGTGASFTVSSKTSLTGSAPTAVSVGVTSAEAVAVNTSRKGLLLVNTSTAYISLAFGAAAVLYSGITLNPLGGSFWMDEYTFTTAQVRAIASGAASNLAVQEFA
jgi:hypothetical protein